MPGSDNPGLFGELKRRKVFRVAAVYAGVGFIVAQAADLAFPALHLPEWTVTLVVVLVLLGFPIALVLAWAFELTPGGVVRTERSSAVSHPADPRSAGSRWSLAVAGVAVLVVAVGGILLWTGAPRAGDPSGTGAPSSDFERSIAVLPFVDLSPDRDHEWFSDGMTEDILIHLSHIGDLKVIGRTSVMRYKNREMGARQIGVELGVATILEGSVRRSGDQVRVGVQLIRTQTDEQLWAESYDRDLTDIFRIQSEIAQQIAATLQARLSPEANVRLAQAPTADLTAYDYYLQGREHNQRLTLLDLERAMELMRQAIAVDPEFAPAHAGLGFAFAAMEGYHQAGHHWLDSAQVAARRAIELDPAGADGYGALALAQWNSGRLSDAVETYARVLEIRPNDGEAYWGLAFTRWHQGDLLEGYQNARRSTELDPGHPAYATLYGRMHANMGDTSGAERWFREALRIQSDFPWAHQDLLWMQIVSGAYEAAESHLRTIAHEPALSREYHQNSFLLALHRGEFDEAWTWYERGRDRVTGGIVSGADAGFVLASLGRHELAGLLWRENAARSRADADRSPENFWPLWSMGRAAAASGDSETALDLLGQAFQVGWRGFPHVDISRDPLLAGLHGQPEFEHLRASILDDVAAARGYSRYRSNQPTM